MSGVRVFLTTLFFFSLPLTRRRPEITEIVLSGVLSIYSTTHIAEFQSFSDHL